MRIQVGPSGLREAKIAIIGEALGEDEVRLGRPFVGLAGQHLNYLLQIAGINRMELYVTNVIKERPPHNNVNVFIKHSSKTGDVTVTENYLEYERYLYNELKDVKANVLVPVGNIALYSLTRKWHITKRRGSIYEGITDIGNRKVIPTIHPAAALRKFDYNYSILADFKRIKAQSEFPEVILPNLTIITKPTFSEALAYIAVCAKSNVVAFDIEVSNGEVSCISFSYEENKGISIPFVWDGSSYYTDKEETDIWFQIGRLLEDPNVYKLTQNGTFDTTYLFDKYGIRCTEVGDTMIQHGILYPELLKGLDFITSTQTEIQYYKDEGKFRGGYSSATDNDFAIYNAKDSIVLMTAYPKLETYTRKQGNYNTYNNQRKLIPILSYMNTLGMCMDVEELQRAKTDALKRRDEAKESLIVMSNGLITNPNSIVQLKKYFYIALGIKEIRAKGSVTTDDPAMKKISLMGYKEADLVQEFRFNKIFASQFFGVILGDDGRLRNSTNPVGTKNGRLSSSKNIMGEGTNTQNLPNLMKRFILADSGFLLYDLDLNQAESRIVAYISPEPSMIEAFEHGIDVHAKTASLIFNKPIEEIGDDETKPCSFGTGKKTERYWGKQSDHAFNYDMGPILFARKHGVRVSDSKFLIARYHSAYPGIRRMHLWVREEMNRNNQTLINPYGRRRKFMGRPGDTMYRQGYNFIPQSTVADKINIDGLIHIYYNQDIYQNVQLLNQVHDSIVLQIPISIPFLEHAEILAHIRDSLETKIDWRGRSFTIPLDARVGFNLARWHVDSNPNGMIDVKISNNISIDSIKHNLMDAYEILKHAA